MALRARGFVDQLKPTLDPVQPPTDVVQPKLNASEIYLHLGKVALEGAKASDHLVELRSCSSRSALIVRNMRSIKSLRSSLTAFSLVSGSN